MLVRHSALHVQSHAHWQCHKPGRGQRLWDLFMASSHQLCNQTSSAWARDHEPKPRFTHTGGAGRSDAGNDAGTTGTPGQGRTRCFLSPGAALALYQTRQRQRWGETHGKGQTWWQPLDWFHSPRSVLSPHAG